MTLACIYDKPIELAVRYIVPFIKRVFLDLRTNSRAIVSNAPQNLMNENIETYSDCP